MKQLLALSAITGTLIACELLVGCGPPPPVDKLTTSTYVGAYVTGSPNPVGKGVNGQNVTGYFVSWISDPHYTDVGSVSSFNGITTTISYTGGSVDGEYVLANAELPANWQATWYGNPGYCVNQANITQHYPQPWVQNFPAYPEWPTGGVMPFICLANDPTHPNFVPSNVSPQFMLDDALPSQIWFAAIDPLPSGGTVTLDTFDGSLNQQTSEVATSISGSGTGATFPFPTSAGSSPLPAGVYLSTISNSFGTGTSTVNGFEPFYIAHDDQSFPGAYGVAVASPKTVTTTSMLEAGVDGPSGCVSSSATDGGTPFPLVTLLTQGLLAVGTASNTILVGSSPTVVIPFHDSPITQTFGRGICTRTVISYSGAQSALVVNTGSNSVSVVSIGDYPYPTGQVAVGNQPVAAVINAAETMAYIANYADGTISEVNLSTLAVTRTLAVMTHPASVAFDSSGNLWVGGQGSVDNVNISSWTITSSTAVDGTVNGMSYDAGSGVLLQTILQNGSSIAPSDGATANALVNYSNSSQVSYTTQNTFNTSTGASTISPYFGDNASYNLSSAAYYLAFPAQTAFTPPIYSSSNGDITATVSGTNFIVSVVSSGAILIQGSLPYPARGVALVSNMVYFTMPDTNSLISLPITLP